MRKFITGSIAVVLVLFSISVCAADIGIIVAFSSSLKKLKECLKIEKVQKKAGRDFYSGRLGDLNIVLVRSPMGKVNNAITSQILLSDYSITSVISIAPAGAVQENLKLGDGVLASEVFQHDFGTIKPYGFVWSQVPDGASDGGAGYNLTDIPLKALALNHTEKTEGCANQMVAGCIVCGDQFISSAQKRDWLSKKFNAAAVDMSSAAIAQVCFVNHKTPVSILRIITDRADLKARTDFARANPSYRTNLDIVGLVKGLVKR